MRRWCAACCHQIYALTTSFMRWGGDCAYAAAAATCNGRQGYYSKGSAFVSIHCSSGITHYTCLVRKRTGMKSANAYVHPDTHTRSVNRFCCYFCWWLCQQDKTVLIIDSANRPGTLVEVGKPEASTGAPCLWRSQHSCATATMPACWQWHKHFWCGMTCNACVHV